ncbi:MAG: exodeoxyribonuclease VII large subunit [Marinilabiliaceae bacterium]|nr:exodeoxyribonuclease VII large subunit [Marinilabiliaceae bacterium]
MQKEAITLFQLCGYLKETINDEFFNDIWVRAEIAEFRENRNGHCYLELIEKQTDSDQVAARVKSIIWSYTYRMLKPYFENETGCSLSNGLKVLVQVSVEFHEVYGLSLVINDIDPTFTLGDLEQRKREIISQLIEKGVFEMNKELPLPIVPQRIAIISSATAAGFGDFINQLENNQYGIKFEHSLFQAIMQGEQAPASIISAFDKIYENIDLYDVVALIRGGGSAIDLLCFDDYNLAYYITQFPLPVITGIGHERDNSIADLVANSSLKTPTAVAQFLISISADFANQIDNFDNLINYLVKEEFDKHFQKIKSFIDKITTMAHLIIQNETNNLNSFSKHLEFSATSYLKNKQKELEFLEKEINLNSPFELLKRGYTLTFLNGKLIKEATLLKQGDIIETKFKDGVVKSAVI